MKAQTGILLPNARPPLEERSFVSSLVEHAISSSQIRDPNVARLFANCYPNTLDTTVFSYDLDLEQHDHTLANPRAYLITGDIAAMWLRDSTNQILPYLPLLSTSGYLTSDPRSLAWTALYRLALGLLYAQADCILLHPFSNAFIPPGSTVMAGGMDLVIPPVPKRKEGQLGVWESKWELDSLASFLQLSSELAAASGRLDMLHHKRWRDAVHLALKVCRLQQRGTDEEVELLPTPWHGPISPPPSTEPREVTDRGLNGRKGIYTFKRRSSAASETRGLNGLGEPARRCGTPALEAVCAAAQPPDTRARLAGLIKSAFRPSDDATVFQYLIPSNAFLSVSARKLADVLARASPSVAELDLEVQSLSSELSSLADEVRSAVWRHGVVSVLHDGRSQEVFAYEVDGYGSYLLGDDANVPSLLSLPMLDFIENTNPVYTATRALVLSNRNKWYFEGPVGEGVGGMHIGSNFVWPMSIAVRAYTSDDDEEILDCIRMLVSTTASTGLMHESFHVQDSTNFTRSHFAWACGLFGQLVLHILATKPYLL